MQGMAWVFFILMAVTLAGMYLAIRREWFSPGVVAGVGVLVSIVLMVLTAFGQGNSAVQAIVVGIVVGGAFSALTVAVAWYFHSQELRQRYAADGHNMEIHEAQDYYDPPLE